MKRNGETTESDGTVQKIDSAVRTVTAAGFHLNLVGWVRYLEPLGSAYSCQSMLTWVVVVRL